MIAPLLVGVLKQNGTRIEIIFVMFFVTILIGALGVLVLGKETKGLELAD